MNAVRSMLSERQVPKEFWCEATRWSVHIQNRSPTTAVKDMTPEEAWSGSKPDVEYFRIFGCIAYAHVPDQKRRKLDDKSRRCRLYDPNTKTIVISKDVVFDEDKSWDWDQTSVKEKILDCGDEQEQSTEEKEGNTAGSSSSFAAGGDSTPLDPVSPLLSPISSYPSRSIEREVVTGPRVRRTPGYLADYDLGEDKEESLSVMLLMMMTENDPVKFEEAVKDKVWREPMKNKIESIEKNNIWELTILPAGFTPVGVKWVYKTKLNKDGEVKKYKGEVGGKGICSVLWHRLY